MRDAGLYLGKPGTEYDGAQEAAAGDFPSGPAVKTARSQCSGPGFILWSGN